MPSRNNNSSNGCKRPKETSRVRFPFSSQTLLCCRLLLSCFLAILIAAADAFASHPCDQCLVNPAGSFQATKLISGNKVGRNIIVQLTGNAYDTDYHWNSAQGIMETDSDDISSYKWVISGLTDSSPTNLTGQSVSFTTKDGTGSGYVLMKVKDAGTHYQDFATETQVASIEAEVVDPDGIRIVPPQNPSWQCVYPPSWRGQASLIWQVTYSGTDLPWAGTIQEEVRRPITRYFNVSSISQIPTGAFEGGSIGNPDQNGRFDDLHTTYDWFAPPDAGKYHVDVTDQRFKNTDVSPPVYLNPTFRDYEYMDSNEDFFHQEY